MINFTSVVNLTFLPSFIFNSIASLNLKELLRIGSVQTLCFNFKRCPTLVQIGFIVVYFLSALWDLFIYICYTQAEVLPDFLVGLKKYLSRKRKSMFLYPHPIVDMKRFYKNLNLTNDGFPDTIFYPTNPYIISRVSQTSSRTRANMATSRGPPASSSVLMVGPNFRWGSSKIRTYVKPVFV